MKRSAHGHYFVMYWMTDEKWFRINKELDRFELTDEAPEKAKKSFEVYKSINNLDY